MTLKKIFNIENFELGEPWTVSDKSLSAVVPILIRNRPRHRNYVLLEEVEDEVDIEDTGSIDKAKIKNNSGHRVFIRKGTLLKGATQNRGVVVGTVILPTQEKTLEIQCVHASSPIRAGAKFKVSGIAPRMVMLSFMGRSNQGTTWKAIQESMHRLTTLGRTPATHLPNDDLVGTLEKVQKFREDVERALEKVPADLEKQVGIAIIDMRGVLGVELFDHPESWRAFSKSIVRNCADVLTQEVSDLYSLNVDKVVDAVKTFFDKLFLCKEDLVDETKDSQTFVLKGEKILGEYTTIIGEINHLIGRREEEALSEHTSPRTSIQTSRRPWERLRRIFWHHKGSYHLLESLSKPKTWKDLEEQLQLSPRTLSRRLTEATSLGFIDSKPRLENGRKLYFLTSKGEKEKRKAKTLYCK